MSAPQLALPPSPEVDEEIWNTWIRRANLREIQTARKVRIFAAAALCLAAIGYAVYLIASGRN